MYRTILRFFSLTLVLVACTVGEIRPIQYGTDAARDVATDRVVAADTNLDRGVRADTSFDVRTEPLRDSASPLDTAMDSRAMDAAREVSVVDAARDTSRVDVAVRDGGIPIGALAITEIFPDPATGISDGSGEWIEVWNSTDEALSLAGCSLDISGRDAVPLSGIIAPHTAATWGNWPAGSDAGGFVLDFSYHGGEEPTLGNSGSLIQILCDGMVVDAVNTRTWENLYQEGRSISLSGRHWTENAHITNNNPSQWCVDRTNVYAGTAPDANTGTPGVVNPDC